MSTTKSVRGFTEFDDLCRGFQGYSNNLVELFDICDHGKLNRNKHPISFKEAFTRLKLRIKESFSALEIQTERKVTDFTIGKTFVKKHERATFNPMKQTTWSLGGGINSRWQFYKKDDYDGLIVLACIERDLIPQNIKECYKRAIQMNKKTIEANQQNYALALEQALIQYYALIKPDERMRNQSFDIGNLSKEIYKGGIVYVAYKLEREPSYSDDELEAHANSEVNEEAGVNGPPLLLAKEKLYYQSLKRGDGNVEVKGESTILKRPAPTEAAVATQSPPLKKQKKKTLVDEHKISKSTPSGDNATKTEPEVQFIPRQRIDDGAQITGGENPSNTSSSKSLSKPKIHMSADENTSSSQSPSKPKIQMSADENTASSKAPSKPKVNMSTDEKKLILKTYIKQEVKSDWDKLGETVYLHRREYLPRTTVEHYEKNLTTASLKQRIKSFIQSVMRGKKENEKDPEVMDLISKIV
ncbi:uncharacterized protein LOC143053912 isoform X2 [Mytilus galloprovincialis]